MKKHFEAMRKAGLSLAIIAFISVLFVAITNQLTKQTILDNQAQMLLLALNEIVPENQYDNDLLASRFTLSAKDTGFTRNTPVYLARKKGQPATAIFEVTTLKGYGGAITLLVGINANNQTISGVRVVKHKETPGLGDKMDTRKTHWVFAFDGKSLGNPDIHGWQVKKDGGQFDQFTGATITPRAIVNAVKSTLLYAQKNMNKLFQHTGEVTTHD